MTVTKCKRPGGREGEEEKQWRGSTLVYPDLRHLAGDAKCCSEFHKHKGLCLQR